MATKKKTKFRKIDIAELLDTPERIAAFVAVSIEEAQGDVPAITAALNTAARAGNMSQLARDTGVSREGLYKALSPEGNPSFGLVCRLLESLGLQLKVTAAR